MEHQISNVSVLWALVNNAGVFTIFGPDDWLEPEDYEEAFSVNCLGAIRLTHVCNKAKNNESP